MRPSAAAKLRIEGYRIGTRLGGKTMTGQVYFCLQKSIKAPRAVKILRPDFVRSVKRSPFGVLGQFEFPQSRFSIPACGIMSV
jgi:hypothetical protein